MAVDVFRFSISSDVPLDEAEMTLQLATFAAEGLFGAARVRLDFGYQLDPQRHSILVEGAAKVGASVIRIFANLLFREFGDEAFRVERIQTNKRQPQEAAA